MGTNYYVTAKVDRSSEYHDRVKSMLAKMAMIESIFDDLRAENDRRAPFPNIDLNEASEGVKNISDRLRSMPGKEELHFGKSSVGWYFAMMTYPSRGLRSWDDWKDYIKLNDATIRDEYGKDLTLEQLTEIVEYRKFPDRSDKFVDIGCEYGVNNLLRTKIDGSFCIGHGDGPWEYSVTVFR